MIALSIVAGLSSYACFAPFKLWWLAPFSLALLLYLLIGKNLRQRVAVVLLYGLSFFAPLLSWTNTYVGDLPWLLLVALQSLLLLPLAMVPFDRERRATLLLFPSLFLLTEALRARLPFGGFGWGRVAFSQADSPIAGLARWGGAPAITFFIAVEATVLIFLVRKEWLWASALTAILAFVAPLAFASAKVPAPSFAVVAVQGGVPSLGLDFNSRAKEVFYRHRSATEKYFTKNRGRTDLVIWPENSVDVDPFLNSDVGVALNDLTARIQAPIVVGAIVERGERIFNASILWRPQAGAGTIYMKRHLTPFGEYIPLRGIAKVLSPYATRVVDFSSGQVSVLHQVGNARIAPIICFELLDDGLGRANTKNSNLIVVQTNSATFGRSAESAQQLGITRIRAIEHQRFVVSVATTGVSAVIGANGEILQQSQGKEVAVLSARLPLIESKSFADSYGGAVELILLSFPLLLLHRLARRPLRKPSS